MNNKYTVHLYDRDFHLSLYKTTYRNNGSLAIILMDDDAQEEFDVISVNISSSFALKKNECYIDINNSPWATMFLRDNNIAKPTGDFGFSGYCAYPCFSFNNIDDIPTLK